MSDNRFSLTDFAVLALGALAIGGSLVFWTVLLGKALTGVAIPYMYVLIVCCVLFPVAGAFIMRALGKGESMTQWLALTLICGGAACIVSYLAKTILDANFDGQLFFPLFCCAAAGCALPAAAALLSRRFIRKKLAKKRAKPVPTAKQQLSSVRSMTNFGKKK